MRTNVVIDDDLMKAALDATGLKTKRAVIEAGLQTLLRLNRQSELKNLRGKLNWEGDLNQLRENREKYVVD